MIDGLRDDQGKRFRKFFESRDSAKAWLSNHAEMTRVEGRAGLLFTEAQRADARRAIAELAAFPGVTLSDAARHYSAHLKRTCSSIPTTELVQQFLSAKEADGRSKRYLGDLKSRLGSFVETFGGIMVGAISTRDVDDWLRDLKSAAQTRTNHRRVLNAFFEFACARGYATENPVKRTEKPKIVRAEPGILSPSQLRSLLNFADSKLVPALAIAAFAGLRPAELRRLTWDAVNIDERFINVSAKTSKTASRRLVPINETLCAWLVRAPSRKGGLLPANDRKLMRRACSAAGITKWPHDALRHSWVTYRYAFSGDAALTAAEAGHDQAILHRHYRALATRSVALQWFDVLPISTGANAIQFPLHASA